MAYNLEHSAVLHSHMSGSIHQAYQGAAPWRVAAAALPVPSAVRRSGNHAVPGAVRRSGNHTEARQ